jgi:hypothetical protein
VGKDSVDILMKGRQILNDAIRKEARAQGHFLTGAFESSLTATVTKAGNETVIEGEALYYQKYLEDGFLAKSASMKQFPFLVKYWQLRGLTVKDAKRAAAATIRKWMKEGMPTAASHSHSSTGSRQDQIKTAFQKSEKKIDSAIIGGFDRGHSTKFNKTKSETI